jgi:O-antigen/teichoic acid export membrane protein
MAQVEDGTRKSYPHRRAGRARAAFTGVLWSGFDHLLPALVGMLVFLLTSRVISPSEFGAVAFAMTVVGIVGSVSPAGFGDALVQRGEMRDAHINVVFWLCVAAAVLLYGLVALLAPTLAAFFDNPLLTDLLYVTGLMIIANLGSVVPTALLTRTMQFRLITIRTLIASVAAGAICLAVLFAGYGLWALVLSQVISTVVVCLVGWLSVDWRPRLRFDRAALRDILRFGIFSSGSRFITTVNVEQLVVGGLLGSAALGLYGFARRVFVMLNQVLTGALGAVSYPLLSSMQNERARLREVYLITTFLSSVVAFPLFVGLALVAGDAVPLLFGGQWRDAVPALQAFCAIGLLSCVGILQAALIRALGRADLWMWYLAAKQALLALVIWAFAGFGVTVVAIAVVVMTWVLWPVTTVIVSRLLDLPLVSYLRQFAVPLLGCLLMMGVVLAVDHALALNRAITLAVEVAAGGVAYAAFIALFARRRLDGILRLVATRAAPATR